MSNTVLASSNSSRGKLPAGLARYSADLFGSAAVAPAGVTVGLECLWVPH